MEVGMHFFKNLTLILILFTTATHTMGTKNSAWRRIVSPILTYGHWAIFAGDSILNTETLFPPRLSKEKLKNRLIDSETEDYVRNHILSPIGMQNADLILVDNPYGSFSAQNNALFLDRWMCSIQELAKINRDNKYEDKNSTLPHTISDIEEALTNVDKTTALIEDSLPKTWANLDAHRNRLLDKKDYLKEKAIFSAIIQHEATHTDCRNDDVFRGSIAQLAMPFLLHAALNVPTAMAKKCFKLLPSLYSGAGVFFKIPAAFVKKELVDIGNMQYSQRLEQQADDGVAQDEDALRSFAQVLQNRHNSFIHRDEQKLHEAIGDNLYRIPWVRKAAIWYRNATVAHPPLIKRSESFAARADALKTARIAQQKSVGA